MYVLRLISKIRVHNPWALVGLYHAHIETAAVAGRVNVGMLKYCDDADAKLAALQQLPPLKGPAVCVVGAVVDAVSVLLFPELSPSIFVESKV